jgi:hypothetical protein
MLNHNLSTSNKRTCTILVKTCRAPRPGDPALSPANVVGQASCMRARNRCGARWQIQLRCDCCWPTHSEIQGACENTPMCPTGSKRRTSSYRTQSHMWMEVCSRQTLGIFLAIGRRHQPPCHGAEATQPQGTYLTDAAVHLLSGGAHTPPALPPYHLGIAMVLP